MSKKAKTILTTILMMMALFQGPYFYYFTSGFPKLIFLLPFAAVGLLLTIILLLNLTIRRSTNTRYHRVGVGVAFAIGLLTSFVPGMEFMDFVFRLHERQSIVDQVKNGPVASGSIADDDFFPLSNGGDIYFTKNQGGSVRVEFYIDRGFLDHYSSFVYTDDRKEISDLKNGNEPMINSVKKLTDYWYRIAD